MPSCKFVRNGRKKEPFLGKTITKMYDIKVLIKEIYKNVPSCSFSFVAPLIGYLLM
jgi:hypothetical protein